MWSVFACLLAVSLDVLVVYAAMVSRCTMCSKEQAALVSRTWYVDQCCREAIGVPELTAPPNTYDLLHKRWCLPSLSIVDIRTTTATTATSTSYSSNGPLQSTSGSKTKAYLRAYAHSAALAGHGASPKHLGCVHMQHDDSNFWPSVVQLSQREKHADDRSCYRFGPTRFSVIPKVAVGKISLRFVPEQDHQTLIECLQQHIDLKFKQLWSANKVELQVSELLCSDPHSRW